MMELQVLWFILVTVLFTGFFFLEGFDYGVGTLLPFLSDKDEERSMVIRTIGPVWDGNEVWMITAGGALFAAFPHVYATMFSTFYFALFLMLLALILRGVAFELRMKHECACWRRSWDAAICFGSAIPAFLWGVAVTNLAQGLPINGNMHYTGSFFDLLSVYTIIGGLAFFFVFAFHGAAFLTIRLAHTGLIYRIRETALKLGACAAAAFVACLLPRRSCCTFGSGRPVPGSRQVHPRRKIPRVLHAEFPRRSLHDRRLLCGALPAPHGIEPHAGMEPHDLQRILLGTDAADHDRRSALSRACRADLPRLDLLDFPQTCDRRGCQTRT